jgi:type VI secretion system secreted protein VgrG
MEQGQSLRYQGIGHGKLRSMRAGHTFKLNKHRIDQANCEWLVTRSELTIEDISESSQSTVLDQLKNPLPHQEWKCEVNFITHPVTGTWELPFRPQQTRQKPFMSGVFSARVIGPDNTQGKSEIWTDRLGRVMVRFPWDRYGKKINNQSDHFYNNSEIRRQGASDETVHAGTARSEGSSQRNITNVLEMGLSCWVRVKTPWAGNQFGSQMIPRVGESVLVSFEYGDVDRPVISHRVANRRNKPMWPLPENQALSGIQSKELYGRGFNQLIFDDSEPSRGGIQTVLVSSHEKIHLLSQLSLGSITRIDRYRGRQERRGEGFELGTTAHGVIRGKKGLFITTEEADAHAISHVKAMPQTIAQLELAKSLHEASTKLAHEAEAQEMGNQDEIVKAIEQQNQEIKGDGTLNANDRVFPELKEPHVVVSSAAGVNINAAESIHIASDQHIALTAAQQMSVSAKNFLATAKEGISLFANKMVQSATTGRFLIIGLKNIIVRGGLTVTVQAGTIIIKAKKKLTLRVGQTVIVFNDQGIFFYVKGKILKWVKEIIQGTPKAFPIEELGLPPTEMDPCKDCAKKSGKRASTAV